MPTYPSLEAEAIHLATITAQRFENYECVECAKAILLAIGPNFDSSVLKLVTRVGRGIIMMPSRSLRVSTTGQHVDVRIADMVYDNHNPNGVPVPDWGALFTDDLFRPLIVYQNATSSFFGLKFRWQAFAGFASNRFQRYE
jgi:Papain fold toxin 2